LFASVTVVATPHADLSNYSQPGQLEQLDGKLFETVLNDGADLRCTVTTGTVIGLTTLDGPLATVRHDGDGIRVTVTGNADFADAFLPADEGSELRAIIDTGVLELSAGQGIMAVPLPIVHAPVTLTVANTASTPLLNMVSKLTVNGVGTTRQAALSGQP
jgi:beta-fructofuranosidase